jgi:two-component system chemotaxis response regulator CheY
LAKLAGARQTQCILAFQVLFVEDDAVVARMYRCKLEAEGYDVTVASDGTEGLEMARSCPPDLMLLDIGLPRLSGVQVLEHVRDEARTREIPVVILTNEDDDQVIERCHRLGIVDWRMKVATTPGLLADLIEAWRTTA